MIEHLTRRRGAQTPPAPRCGTQRCHARRHGFTLIEILVVIVIIALLGALLFPAFKRAQESGYQKSCASNLQQIGTAVQLYRADEKDFPGSIAALLPDNERLQNYNNGVTTVGTAACDTANSTCPNPRGQGHLKSTKNLICPNDDREEALRSSYGDVSANPTVGPGNAATDDPAYLSRFTWNFWGYRNDAGYEGTARPSCVSGSSGGGQSGSAGVGCHDAAAETSYKNAFTGERRFLVDPSAAYSATNLVDEQRLPRLANRNAPSTTIITHCIFHRVATADISAPNNVYPRTDPPNTENGKGARDVVLRVDGSAKSIDISAFNLTPKGEAANPPDTAPGQWQGQSFR